jgi:hypothetical protein
MGNSSQLTKHHWKKTTTTETTRNKHGQHPEKKNIQHIPATSMVYDSQRKANDWELFTPH